MKDKFEIRSEANLDKKITEAIKEEGHWWETRKVKLKGPKGKPLVLPSSRTCHITYDTSSEAEVTPVPKLRLPEIRDR